MESKEMQRRTKISAKLKAYYETKQGILHRNKLSELQKKRMVEYKNYINNNLKK